MLLTLDIQKKAAPVIIQTSKKLPDVNPNALRESLGDFILCIEGFDNHIFALSKPATKQLLDETSGVILQFVDIDEKANWAEYEAEVKDRFVYSLKALYKLKSLLHIAYTKDVTVQKTPEYLKAGLAAVSRSSVLHSLSKHK